MRKAIYDFLKLPDTIQQTGITSWYGGPYLATKSSAKPYGVLVVGEELRSVENDRGLFKEVQIWPYFAKGSFITLDGTVLALRNLLHGKQFTTASGVVFVLEYIYTGRDFHDEELDAFTKRVDFRVPLIV